MDIFSPTPEFNDIYSYGFDKGLYKIPITGIKIGEESNDIFYNLISESITPEMIRSGNLTGVLTLVAGNLQSSVFVTGTKGWRISSSGDVEFSTGTFRGSIAIGSGNSIFKADSNGVYLGNTTFASAPFSVDMSGNLIATSITAGDRKDMHWFTAFESIDGYNKTAGIALDSSGRGIILTTTTDLNDIKQIYKTMGVYVPTYMTWDKKRKMRTKVRFEQNANQTIWLINGDSGVDQQRIGFKVNNNLLIGNSAGSASEDTATLKTLTAGDVVDLEWIFTPGVSVEFFVDGVSSATITSASALPSGVTNAAYLILSSVKTTNTDAKVIQIGFWDFWQSS